MAELPTRLSTLAALTLAASGCALAPQPGPQDPDADEIPVTAPQRQERRAGPATATLIEQSRALHESGQSAQAAVTLERALRIEPNDPAVWLELARLRYAAADWAQAEQFARRAESLAGGDPALRKQAVELIADSLVRQGRPTEAERLRSGG